MSAERDRYHHSHQSRSARSPRPETSGAVYALGQASIAPNAPLHPRQANPYETDASSTAPVAAWDDPAASRGRGGSSYGTHQDFSDRYASPAFPRGQYSYAAYPVDHDAYASPTDVNPSQASYWDQRYPYTSSTSTVPGPMATAPVFPPVYEAAYGVAGTAPQYSTSYAYGTPDPTAPYYYGLTSAYEPRNSSSTVSFTNALLSPPEHVALSGSRSVTSAARTGARSHVPTTHSASYNPYSRTRPPIASSSANTESSGGARDYPIAIKKKRKRANVDQLMVLNDVYDRNPFPPTTEREQLAQQLGMTPRSVQIWFQNKRQAARQGGRGGQPPKPTSTGHGDSSEVASSPTVSSRATADPTSSVGISAPSASAPRGAPGYVASPTLRTRTISPPHAGSAPIQPQTIVVEPYNLRRPHTPDLSVGTPMQAPSTRRRR